MGAKPSKAAQDEGVSSGCFGGSKPKRQKDVPPAQLPPNSTPADQPVARAQAPQPSTTAVRADGVDNVGPTARSFTYSAQPSPQPSAACAYTGAPIPGNDDQRIAHLCGLDILNTAADPRFDDITSLVCSIFKVPIALVSLVERERQWFKSVQGLPVSETPRDPSFCAWTLLPVNPEVLVVEDALEDARCAPTPASVQGSLHNFHHRTLTSPNPEVFVVEDALTDARFRDNPLVVGNPFIRFYAGAPLITAEGFRLGSLCAIDTKPRTFDAESCNLLCNFAEMVVREIEKEKVRVNESVALSRHTSGLLRAMDAFAEGIMLVDTGPEKWTVMFINDACIKLTGRSREEVVGADLWDIFQLPKMSKQEGIAMCIPTIEQKVEFQLDFLHTTSEGRRRLTANFKPAATDALGKDMPLIGIPGFVAWDDNKIPSYYFATISQVAMLGSMEGTPLGSANSMSGPLGSSGSMTGSSKWRPLAVNSKKEAFDDVQLGPLLGKGSFGRVYRGMWNGAPVAVKIIEQPLTDIPEGDSVGKVGILEAYLSTDLSHPNVVQTFKSAIKPVEESSVDACFVLLQEAGRRMQEVWLLLEFCDRGALQDAADRGSFRAVRLGTQGSQADVMAIINTATEIASAMCYLHSLDILHGDLTGGNILLISSPKDERGFSAKVADFGLSRVMTNGSINTGTYGTVTHMPPELLTTGRLSKAADVYAFGVLVWEMYTGQRPWGGMMQMQVIFNITVLKQKLDFPPDTPEKLKGLALRCMDTDPAERPTFKEVLRLLDECREQAPAWVAAATAAAPPAAAGPAISPFALVSATDDTTTSAPQLAQPGSNVSSGALPGTPTFFRTSAGGLPGGGRSEPPTSALSEEEAALEAFCNAEATQFAGVEEPPMPMLPPQQQPPPQQQAASLAEWGVR